MLSIDPWNDPHGALLHLDFLSIKAGMSQWLLDTYDLFAKRHENSSENADARLNPSLLPGWAYARVLSLKISEDASKDKVLTSRTHSTKRTLIYYQSDIRIIPKVLQP